MKLSQQLTKRRAVLGLLGLSLLGCFLLPAEVSRPRQLVGPLLVLGRAVTYVGLRRAAEPPRPGRGTD